jgi:amidase
MEYIITREQCVYSMSSKNSPVLKVPAGSIVTFDTCDCFENQIKSESDSIEQLNWEHINPASGPLYVESAEPGDVLKVEILSIKVAEYGVMAAIPDGGLLGSSIKKSEIKIIPVQDGKAVFNDKIKIPVEPMIGVIGVAPEIGEMPCGSPGSHGGNMDNTRIKEGSTLYLPVYVEGGLLSMGDLHACMGDGEIMVTGVEIPGNVKVKVDVIKDSKLNNPILEDSEYIYTIASHEDLMTAVRTSTEGMHTYIMDKLAMSYNEAGMLLSAAGNVQICQVVDPKLTVRFAFPKKYL